MDPIGPDERLIGKFPRRNPTDGPWSRDYEAVLGPDGETVALVGSLKKDRRAIAWPCDGDHASAGHSPEECAVALANSAVISAAPALLTDPCVG